MSPSRKQRSCAIASVLATAVAVATAAPAALAATTVTYSPGGINPGMNVTDDPGNAVHLVVTSGTQNNHVGVRSNNAEPLTAGSGCLQVSATEVSCFASGPRIVTADLGDGDDRLGHGFGVVNGSFIRGGDGNDTIDGADQADSLDGGAGDDRIQGASGDDVLNGGPGNDVFLTNHLETGNDVKNGGDGNDRIIGTRDPGNDVYSGGAGVDLLDFSDSDGGVAISLDDVANDGPAGQTDNAASDIENLKGGRGNDTLLGDSGRNLIEGFAGNDTLRGGSPPPSRTGTTITSLLGDDTLDGGVGSDVMHGEGGDDRLLARDAVDDQVAAAMTCGAGNDRLDTDLADDDTRPLPVSCESIDQGAINEGANVRIASRTLRVSRGGRVRVRLRCPRSVTIGCRGRLAAGSPRRAGLRALGSRTRYRIRAGRKAHVTVRLPRSLRRAAARRGRVRARVVSLETGSHGPKLTIRPVRLR
jgi:Ca2+-binding RTX toxin-like protein